eukprot:evm.model.scf_929.5 EVM.evm.TU.scf_929.5   scf_929:27068-30756(-)
MESIEGLMTIWRRLRAECDRKNSTPAMRLLDEALSLISADMGGSREDRLEMVSDRLEAAFTGPQSLPVDIFGVAASLAEGEEPPEELVQECVAQDAFVKEVEALLDTAKKEWQEMERVLQRMKADLETNGLSGDDRRALEQEVDRLSKAAIDQEVALMDVEEIVGCARDVLVWPPRAD